MTLIPLKIIREQPLKFLAYAVQEIFPGVKLIFRENDRSWFLL